MSRAVPLVVLAAPGAGGAQLAAALAAASERPLVAWDEVADEALGDGQVLRTAAREVLWRRERDWTCPPGVFEVDDRDRVLAGPLHTLLAAHPAPVLYEVALPFLLPLLLDACEELLVVVVARDPREALPHLLGGQELEPGFADELLRATHERLAALAATDGVSVVGVTGELDLATAAATLTGTSPREPRLLPPVEPHSGVEEDRAADALLDDGEMAPPRPVTGEELPAVATDATARWLDRYGGPRTAARRSLLQGVAASLGPSGPMLECSRARGLGAWMVTDLPVQVAVVDDVSTMQRAATVPPASQAAVLLSDVTSWCRPEDLRAVLELAMGAVRYGGVLVVGRSTADDEARHLAGLDPLDDGDITTLARDLGLVPLPTRPRGQGARGLCFAAQTAAAGTIRDLEETVQALEERLARADAHLERRTEQRDAAVARFEALRDRRSVRAVLRAADAAGGVVGVVRRLRGDQRG